MILCKTRNIEIKKEFDNIYFEIKDIFDKNNIINIKLTLLDIIKLHRIFYALGNNNIELLKHYYCINNEEVSFKYLRNDNNQYIIFEFQNIKNNINKNITMKLDTIILLIDIIDNILDFSSLLNHIEIESRKWYINENKIDTSKYTIYKSSERDHIDEKLKIDLQTYLNHYKTNVISLFNK